MFRRLRGCLCVCLSVSHNHELCQNGRTNRDVVRAVVSGAPKESCTGLGAQIPPKLKGGNFGGAHLRCSVSSEFFDHLHTCIIQIKLDSTLVKK